MPFVVVRYSCGNAILDVERPRELVQAALGELGHVDPRGALRESDRRRCRRVFLARVVPEVELAAHEEEKSVLKPHDEGPTVELEERESRSESAHNRDERACKVDR